MIRLIAIAAATMTISTGPAMAETDGYVYPDPPPGRVLATNSAGLSSTPTRHELPMRAIVNGRNVQPRGDRLKALGYSDLTSREAEEVDRLYRELMPNNLVAIRTPS
jgi:hypothetical protein